MARVSSPVSPGVRLSYPDSSGAWRDRKDEGGGWGVGPGEGGVLGMFDKLPLAEAGKQNGVFFLPFLFLFSLHLFALQAGDHWSCPTITPLSCLSWWLSTSGKEPVWHVFVLKAGLWFSRLFILLVGKRGHFSLNCATLQNRKNKIKINRQPAWIKFCTSP